MFLPPSHFIWCPFAFHWLSLPSSWWQNFQAALKDFQALLVESPTSVVALHGIAQSLDGLAEQHGSNTLLDQAIAAYDSTLKLGSQLSHQTFTEVAYRCINRILFRGQHIKAVPIHQMLMESFPEEPNHANQLSVTYLTMNKVQEAKQLLINTLQKWPDDGFAMVLYGFILKTTDDDLTRAVKLLQRGIASGAPGTVDGRFFFHLGDALVRLGHKEEAMKIHEQGVKEGLFLSKHQRSLYNVNHLTARPWWSLEETTYAQDFQKLINNWMLIKSEGLLALSNSTKSLFKDESENLRDFGDWKQLELFVRGQRVNRNCEKVPQTCQLIENFPASRSCRRGQVKFSVMESGTHVWPHCGPTNCRLRAHLGLVVPAGTHIRVAEVTRTWEEGKIFIFDDSFEHEVWHNGTSFRLVLIVDVWHPELTEQEKKSLPAI